MNATVCNKDRATIWVVGDSTLALFHEDDADRVGYGVELDRFFNATVFNLAHPGASSLSFTRLPEYRTLMDGDSDTPALGDASGERFLIIGFGHNDEKRDDRFTDPNGNRNVSGSFANSLYENYIKPALERNVVPVLCTPIARLSEENTPGSYCGRCVHVTQDDIVDGRLYRGGDYRKAVLGLAGELNLPFLDMTSATSAMYLELGDNVRRLFAHTGPEDDISALDRTHTKECGAMMNAWLLSVLSEKTAQCLYRWSIHRERPDLT